MPRRRRIEIDEGYHGDTRLDGLRIAAIFKWPGAIHEGNGEALAFVDERADEAQREALLRIMTGQDTDPFATMFAVYASTVTNMHEPVFTDIDFEVDVEGRRGRLRIEGYVEMVGEPIRNKVTGEESRAQIVLPAGFEYEVADIGSASSRTTGRCRSSSRIATASSPTCTSTATGGPQLTKVSPGFDVAERIARRSRAVTIVALACWRCSPGPIS